MDNQPVWQIFKYIALLQQKFLDSLVVLERLSVVKLSESYLKDGIEKRNESKEHVIAHLLLVVVLILVKLECKHYYIDNEHEIWENVVDICNEICGSHPEQPKSIKQWLNLYEANFLIFVLKIIRVDYDLPWQLEYQNHDQQYVVGPFLN